MGILLDCIQEHQALITTIGLALNVVGSIIFIFDSKMLSRWLIFMVGRMAQDHGKKDGKKFSENEMKGLYKSVRNSGRRTLLGFSFFLGGFALQLIPRLFI